MTTTEQAARQALPEPARAPFDDIVEKRVLGASNHVDMIGDMIEQIVLDATAADQPVARAIERIKTVTDYFIETRGASTQAIPNAIRVMIRGLDLYASADDLAEAGASIIATKNAYRGIAAAAIAQAIETAVVLLADRRTLLAYDYSSTVERVLVALGELDPDRTVIIPESRAINGGAPFVLACQQVGLRIRFVPDAALLVELKTADAILMGAETFYPDGTAFNTLGSDIVGVLAEQLGVPLYFVTTFSKLDARMIRGVTKDLPLVDLRPELGPCLPAEVDADAIDFVVPELIGVRREHIEAFITELGVIPPAGMWTPSLTYFNELTGGAP